MRLLFKETLVIIEKTKNLVCWRKVMVHFTLALAGKTVGVTAFFESTKEYCREYLCKEKADFSVSVTLEDIQREKEFFGKNLGEISPRLHIVNAKEKIEMEIKKYMELAKKEEILDEG